MDDRETYQYLKKHLCAEPHPEGGWTSQDVRARGSERGKYNSCHYLLGPAEFCAFHRLGVDEVWSYNAGCPIEIFSMYREKFLKRETLGSDFKNGHKTNLVILAGSWFGAKPIFNDGYSLVTCICIPAFKFDKWELAKEEEMLKTYKDVAAAEQYIRTYCIR